MTTRVFNVFTKSASKLQLLCVLVFASGWLAGILRAQSMPEQFQRFEVASIRPSAGNEHPGIEFTPGGIRATNLPLKVLIEAAYEIRDGQLSGGPGWIDSDPYTILAKSPEGGPPLSPAEEHALTLKRLQALLAERFDLALKHEVKEASGYVLTVEKTGHTMTVADDSGVHLLRQVGRWQVNAEGVKMSRFAGFLSVHLQAAVEDQTGLTGYFTFKLDWTPEQLPSSIETLNGIPEETLISAVREQLGLRLVPQKVATDQYTIERAEKPTEN